MLEVSMGESLRRRPFGWYSVSVSKRVDRVELSVRNLFLAFTKRSSLLLLFPLLTFGFHVAIAVVRSRQSLKLVWTE
jgi:hypothetical protein